MIDNFKPLEMKSIADRIKGHVQIDLHDTRTGFNERIEKDNLVTNALDTLSKFSLTSPNGYFSPIATKALGGIMLFDNAIEESASNVYLPSDSHIVGMAGQTAETDDFRGTYNTEESCVIENGYTSVWDFATNQCNGQIGAVARTHADILNSYSLTPSIGSLLTVIYDSSLSSAYGLAYDKANGYYYFYDTKDSKVKRIKYFANKLGVCDEFRDTFKSYNLKPYEYEEVEDLSGTNVRNPGFNQDGYTYEETSCQNSGGITVSLTITRIKCSDYSFGAETKTFDVSSLNVLFYNFFYASNGYIYYLTSNRSQIFKINFNNPADMVEVIKESDGVTNISGVRLTKTGVAIVDAYYNGSSCVIYIYPDDTFVINTKPGYINLRQGMQIDDGSWIGFYDSGNYYIVRNRMYEYLGTIANVGPFQKNSTQTMKITYSLTNASS